MKKVLLIGAIVLVVAAAVALAGVAYAKANSALPDANRTVVKIIRQGGWNKGGGYGPGMMGRGDDVGPGMLGRWRGKNQRGGGTGPMHQYMFEALAEQLGLTPEELQTRLDAGQTPYQIAKDKGLSDDQIRELFEKAHDAALAKAVEAGLLTQEQADGMDKHMEQRWEGGFGPGFGPCQSTDSEK